MKKILLILCLLPIAVSALSQKSFNDAQLKLRSDIEVFLREEGFMPTIDKDGDIAFKKEGSKYYVIIDERDFSPFYVRLSRFYNYNEKYSRQNIVKNLAELNLKKGVKLICFDDYYIYEAEMYLINAENFKHVFYKLLEQLEALEKATGDLCAKSAS